MIRKHFANRFDIVKWYERLFQKDPVSLTFSLTIILALILALVSKNVYANKWEEFIVQMVAEAHGILFDILVLGILFVWINRISERKKSIQRCLETIDDLRLKHTDIVDFNYLHEKHSKPLGGQIDEKYPSYTYSLRPSSWWNSEYVRIEIIQSIKLLARNKVQMLDLHNINVSGGRFPSINLRKSKLSCSLLVDCQLSHSNLSLTECHETNFTGSCLDHADFEEASLIGAAFVESSLQYTKFTGAKLVAADFRRAYLTHAKLDNCNLAGADFTGAHILNVDFRNASDLTAHQICKAKSVHNCKFDSDLEKSIEFLKKVSMKEVADSSGPQVQPRKVQIVG
jgi:hypothetical protein